MTTRKALSRELILNAAKKISNQSSVENVTIRKLAKDLDVTPMAIYRHFSNKAEILSELLDQFIYDAQVVNHDTEDWEAWLHVTFERMQQALSAHPHFLPLLGNAITLGENAVSVTEQVLMVLKDNIREDLVVNAFFSLLNYTVGAATTKISAGNFLSVSDQKKKNRVKQSQMRIDIFQAGNYPTLMSMASEMDQAVAGDQFHRGLDTIIHGIKNSMV